MASMHRVHQTSVTRLAPVVAELINTDVTIY